MPMPRWKAEVEASAAALPSRAASAGGSEPVFGTASGCALASATVFAAAGLSGAGPRLASSTAPKWAEITAPRTAIASRPATRETPLLTPEAIPTWRSSTESSTVAVSGATVAERPRPKTRIAGSTSVT